MADVLCSFHIEINKCFMSEGARWYNVASVEENWQSCWQIRSNIRHRSMESNKPRPEGGASKFVEEGRHSRL